ncbi:hypothetical protein NDU88_001166 [Pleurodeles waltl]|uniref:Uncharacterized protein n=1 Tax=Pleurodeles waltl TaxID=8319 RepID=A0AAV7P4Y2_PLEWA|nr:hypothetical protein NDU88_001166 [Pleurodeles waltl]
MERKNNPAKEMAGKISWDDKEYSDELDEYILDMSNGNEMDEFNILDKTEIEQRKEMKDPLGHALFEPSDVKHPRSAEWKPLERNERNVMGAECSRPVIGEKDSMTPNLDPDLITYLFKLGRDPRKGLERSLKQFSAINPTSQIATLASNRIASSMDGNQSRDIAGSSPNVDSALVSFEFFSPKPAKREDQGDISFRHPDPVS